MINSTIAGNTAVNGGGVILRSFGGTAFFQNSTIAANNATGTDLTLPGSGGGGIDQASGAGTIVLNSTIVSGNTAANGLADIANGGSTGILANFSAIGSNNGFAFAAGTRKISPPVRT